MTSEKLIILFLFKNYTKNNTKHTKIKRNEFLSAGFEFDITSTKHKSTRYESIQNKGNMMSNFGLTPERSDITYDNFRKIGYNV